MLDYAVEYEMVDRNYARTFSLSDEIIDGANTVEKEHIPYTDEEMKILWDNVDRVKLVDVIIYQCYSGWRPQELGHIELGNVDLENEFITGGMKTPAGKDRIVPIHPRIKHLILRNYQEAQALHSKYLFNSTNPKNTSKTFMLTYERFIIAYAKIRDELNLNPDHRPHDGRKHFVTMAKKYNVDEYAIKYIAGHHISDITEKVYTQREPSWLKEEIEKIK